MKSTDCLVPSFGHVNQDGYVRVLDKPRSQGGLLKMKHRLEWEHVNGPIPYGYEINHLCKNRACYNLEHLECIPRSEHRAKDNSLRYKERIDEVVLFMKNNPNVSQKEIGKLFGYSQAGISKIYIKHIKEK